MSDDLFPVFARDGTQVLAGPAPDPSPQQLALAREAWPLEFARATALRPPTGTYNCHGLVFASRRAGIPPVGADVDVGALLRRDGYQPIRDPQPQVGDIVAYRQGDEIEHTGFVSRVEESAVFIWSAWGGLGEFEHLVHASPYRGTPEYWRLSCHS